MSQLSPLASCCLCVWLAKLLGIEPRSLGWEPSTSTATVLQFLVVWVWVVELEGIEPPSTHCIVLPLKYGPKGGLYRIRTRSGDVDNVPCYHYTNKPVGWGGVAGQCRESNPERTLPKRQWCR